MEQYFIAVEGIRLAYLEQNPEAPQTICFIHGNSVSSLTWRKQFSDPRLARYRLIAFDLPAHGASQEIPDRDYNLVRLGEIAADAVKQLLPAGTRYMLIGFSLGANVVTEMLNFDIRPVGIVLIGPSIVGGKYGLSDLILEGADVSAIFADGVPEEVVRRYAITSSLSGDPADQEAFLKDYYQTRSPFRTIFFSSLGKEKYKDEVLLLADAGVPVCIIFGWEEKIANPYYLDDAPFELWGEDVHLIPGASHFAHIDNPKAVNALLAAYANERFLSDNT